tara:strand:- start:86 stop:568 length:483 start_codon:yes stop_codon:yes gene_type:complete
MDYKERNDYLRTIQPCRLCGRNFIPLESIGRWECSVHRQECLLDIAGIAPCCGQSSGCMVSDHLGVDETGADAKIAFPHFKNPFKDNRELSVAHKEFVERHKEVCGGRVVICEPYTEAMTYDELTEKEKEWDTTALVPAKAFVYVVRQPGVSVADYVPPH